MGNSQGIIIPKPLLAQIGLENEAVMTFERGALVLRSPAKSVRQGWSDDAKKIAAADGDPLVLGEFPNHNDAELQW